MSDRENMLAKVRALLSKTVENGCTEEEALSALAKAQAMMDSYEISESELQLTKDEKAVLRREPSGTKDPHKIKAYLAKSVSEFAGCRVWRSGEALTFCGLKSDAHMATWLLDHLQGYVLRALCDHLHTDVGANRTAVINGFVAGATSRISERLKELTRNSEVAAVGNGRALMVVKGQAIADRMKAEGINLHSARSSRRTMDHGAYAAGQSAGNGASFGRPVSGSGAVLRLK